MILVIHERLDAITARKALDNAFFMLPNSPGKIAGDADIESPVSLASEDVDARPKVSIPRMKERGILPL
jgi:hypothetical protein